MVYKYLATVGDELKAKKCFWNIKTAGDREVIAVRRDLGSLESAKEDLMKTLSNEKALQEMIGKKHNAQEVIDHIRKGTIVVMPKIEKREEYIGLFG